jgi:calcineurin-like phosphoesterase family protein
MNAVIVKRWNTIVKPDDEVYILGDLMLNDTEEGLVYFKLLNGFKHIIIGNHDSNKRIEAYKKLPNTIVEGFAARLKFNGYRFYLTHYPTLVSNFDCEEPLKKQLINVCGHSHTMHWDIDMDKGLIFHCELDTNNCFPWKLEDVIHNIKEYRDTLI